MISGLKLGKIENIVITKKNTSDGIVKSDRGQVRKITDKQMQRLTFHDA